MKQGERSAKKMERLVMPPVETSPQGHISDEMEFDEENSPTKDGLTVPEEEKEFIAQGRRASSSSAESVSNALDSSADSSQKSVKIIEFDEEGNISPGNKKKKPKKGSFEMVDLKAKKNMAQLGAIEDRKLVSAPEKQGKSANARKKEKKKLRDLKAKQEAEALEKKRLLEKGNELELKEMKLKRKVLPARKTVVDEKGEEWNEVTKRQTVLVEDSDED